LRLFTGSALGTAADVRHIEEIAYRDGAKGLLDYLDAQRTYNQTLVDYNQARFDFLMSLYQLEFATGSAIVK
jgi:cobalt-zinc-cadmium efflux system outer membrane protein